MIFTPPHPANTLMVTRPEGVTPRFANFWVCVRARANSGLCVVSANSASMGPPDVNPHYHFNQSTPVYSLIGVASSSLSELVLGVVYNTQWAYEAVSAP